ncbi:hypothetical protein NKE62_00430 [Akkermansia sp. Marseille-P9185]|jgi:hypothetical protein|uniref:hypothetical protein n=1 Tax=Akkermansia massiliensis TaxID=2927224 RepID=UPI00209C05E8|nr:hypothetical protein [Akkermansia massiliensis]MCO8185386.1 hypothetical protein [Akkermansia massiliensis]
MKDKPIKQPWPRSARITVWVLLALLLVLGVACMKCRHDLELLEIKDTEGYIIEENPVIKTLPEGTTIRIWPSGRVEFVLPNAVMPLTVKKMKSM